MPAGFSSQSFCAVFMHGSAQKGSLKTGRFSVVLNCLLTLIPEGTPGTQHLWKWAHSLNSNSWNRKNLSKEKVVTIFLLLLLANYNQNWPTCCNKSDLPAGRTDSTELPNASHSTELCASLTLTHFRSSGDAQGPVGWELGQPGAVGATSPGQGLELSDILRSLPTQAFCASMTLCTKQFWKGTRPRQRLWSQTPTQRQNCRLWALLLLTFI